MADQRPPQPPPPPGEPWRPQGSPPPTPQDSQPQGGQAHGQQGALAPRQQGGDLDRAGSHEAQSSRREEEAPGLLAPVAGFGVTFRTLFRKVYTEEYPDEKRPTAPRFHGRHQLNRHPDGLEKCVGCELCAWACPADAILVEGASNNDATGERFSPGERYGRVYQINYLRCIFCGMCIEACPTRALTMTNFYELADDNRADLIFTKEQLLAPLQQGMLQPPFPMADGMEERDYFLGKVTGPTSGQQAAVDRRDRGTQEAADEASGAHESPAEHGWTGAGPITGPAIQAGNATTDGGVR